MGGIKLFAILSFLLIMLAFYFIGEVLVTFLKVTISPVVLSIPIAYLVFLFTLNVKGTLLVLFIASLVAGIVVFRKINFPNFFKFLLTAVILYFIICQHPLLGWDTRSIWFFHSKILYFFNSSEIMTHLNREEIAFFSHSDYPKLQPFLGSLFAIPFSEWQEQIAKASLALLWTPVFTELIQLKNIKIKGISIFCVLVLSGGQLIAGMTDWLLACYVLMAFLIYFEDENRWLDSIALLSLPILIKAEGLVLSVLGISIILILKSGLSWRSVFKHFAMTLKLVAVPVLAFIVWKLLCAHYSIHNYLTNDPSAAIAKLMGRLTDGGKSFWIFVDAFGYYNKIIKNMVYVALIRRLLIWKKITHFEVAAFSFAGIYSCFLFFTYMATPFDLDWHLSTSIERTAFPVFLLMLVTLLIRDIDVVKKV